MSLRSCSSVVFSSIAVSVGYIVYLAALVPIAYTFYIIPSPYFIAFAVLLYLPHFMALLYIRRPLPWYRYRREDLVLLYAAYATIPLGCILLVALLGFGSMMNITRSLNPVAITIGYTIFFTILSIGTALIAGGLLSKRRVFYASHCKQCLYDLTAVEADTCPECNTPITRSEYLPTQSSHPAHSQAAQDTDQAELP